MIKLKILATKAAGLLLAVCLAGCKPVATYETTYQFNEPRTEAGRVCIQQCQSSKQACTTRIETPAECHQEYQACYQLCGGEVIENRTCITNCPEMV